MFCFSGVQRLVRGHKEMPRLANEISKLEESHQSSSPAAVTRGSKQMGTKLPNVISWLT